MQSAPLMGSTYSAKFSIKFRASVCVPLLLHIHITYHIVVNAIEVWAVCHFQYMLHLTSPSLDGEVFSLRLAIPVCAFFWEHLIIAAISFALQRPPRPKTREKNRRLLWQQLFERLEYKLAQEGGHRGVLKHLRLWR
ncbi:hypothetical protein B0O99DRAFT_669592 [Bisporella sp. PMI_857]|nr:hypothetical protein B0O99DRAFT_669592 [Bisporella sp. PMI_857]